MLSDFINENLPRVDYRLKIQSFNPLEPQQEYVEIIAVYRTPNRSYIKTSARNLNTNDAELDVLTYIIEECHQCSEQQKYEASIVALHQFHQMRHDVALTNQLKQKIMDSFDYNEGGNEPNYEWADKYSNGTQKIFYLLYITIGKNKLVKLGITNDRLRQRLAGLKSDIKDKYKYALHVEPLLIIDCEDNELFEDEVKILILEHGCVNTGFNFRGSNETFSIKCKDELMSIAIKIVERYGDHILFNANVSSGSNLQEERPVSITKKVILPWDNNEI